MATAITGIQISGSITGVGAGYTDDKLITADEIAKMSVNEFTSFLKHCHTNGINPSSDSTVADAMAKKITGMSDADFKNYLSFSKNNGGVIDFTLPDAAKSIKGVGSAYTSDGKITAEEVSKMSTAELKALLKYSKDKNISLPADVDLAIAREINGMSSSNALEFSEYISKNAITLPSAALSALNTKLSGYASGVKATNEPKIKEAERQISEYKKEYKSLGEKIKNNTAEYNELGKEIKALQAERKTATPARKTKIDELIAGKQAEQRGLLKENANLTKKQGEVYKDEATNQGNVAKWKAEIEAADATATAAKKKLEASDANASAKKAMRDTIVSMVMGWINKANEN
ncbi:MAG: hypothetical protein ACK5NY_10925 [Burkholderiaceae bacterium]